MELPQFLQDECERCRGPIIAEPHRETIFLEATWDYVVLTFWICYSCGHQHRFES